MILEHVKAYAKMGWRVFPCHGVVNGVCTCGNSECTAKGKHPATHRGFKDATTKGIELDLWWSRNPIANVGIATGSVSNLCVLDIDTKTGMDGALAIAWGLFRSGRLPPTWSARSGSGGLHFYYRLDGQIVKTRNRVLPMVDIKGENSQITIPPSVNGNGPYIWRKRPGPVPGIAPHWMVEKESKTKQRRPLCRDRTRNSPADLPAIPEGGRNHRIFKIGCGLAGAGEPPGYIEDFLLELNRLRCTPPIPEKELAKTINSVLKYAR